MAGKVQGKCTALCQSVDTSNSLEKHTFWCMSIANEYRKHGFRMALDDFGAGFSGLNVLAEVKPDIVKFDMDLIRGIERRPTAFAIIQALTDLCHRLGIEVVAEGVETLDEFRTLKKCGIHLMQGYLFARPGFEALPAISIPVDCFEDSDSWGGSLLARDKPHR